MNRSVIFAAVTALLVLATSASAESYFGEVAFRAAPLP